MTRQPSPIEATPKRGHYEVAVVNLPKDLNDLLNIRSLKTGQTKSELIVASLLKDRELLDPKK